MTDESTAAEIDREGSNAADKVPDSNRAWFPAALTLLGSTGALSVFGPLTGQLYWDGFLAAFGLTPEEFPAAPSQVTIYAYSAILHGVITVGKQLWSLWPLFATFAVAVTAISVTVKLPKVRSRADAVVEVVNRRSGGVDAGSLAFQWVTRLTLFILSLLVVGYFLLMMAVLIISPYQARQLGLREGERIRALQANAVPGTPACMSISVNSTTFSCPAVVAFGNKVIAVLDGSHV